MRVSTTEPSDRAAAEFEMSDVSHALALVGTVEVSHVLGQRERLGKGGSLEPGTSYRESAIDDRLAEPHERRTTVAGERSGSNVVGRVSSPGW